MSKTTTGRQMLEALEQRVRFLEREMESLQKFRAEQELRDMGINPPTITKQIDA